MISDFFGPGGASERNIEQSWGRTKALSSSQGSQGKAGSPAPHRRLDGRLSLQPGAHMVLGGLALCLRTVAKNKAAQLRRRPNASVTLPESPRSLSRSLDFSSSRPLECPLPSCCEFVNEMPMVLFPGGWLGSPHGVSSIQACPLSSQTPQRAPVLASPWRRVGLGRSQASSRGLHSLQ